MANLANPRDCAAWIHQAVAAGYDRRPVSNPFSIRAVAIEQRRNLRGIENALQATGCAPTWCTIAEYRQSVALLLRAARNCPTAEDLARESYARRKAVKA